MPPGWGSWLLLPPWMKLKARDPLPPWMKLKASDIYEKKPRFSRHFPIHFGTFPRSSPPPLPRSLRSAGRKEPVPTYANAPDSGHAEPFSFLSFFLVLHTRRGDVHMESTVRTCDEQCSCAVCRFQSRRFREGRLCQTLIWRCALISICGGLMTCD